MKKITATLIPLFFAAAIFCQEFENVTSLQGIDVYNEDSVFGNGVSFADFNGDGWDDLSFGTIDNDPIFYVNQDGYYAQLNLGITNEAEGDIKAILWVDYDNDGDKDLFISTSYYPVKLYNNDGSMNLTDVTNSAGLLSETTRNFGACWADFNKDGWLDLYLCKYHNPDLNIGYTYENHLYQSNQDGTFDEVANFADVDNGILPSFQSVFFDFDKDGLEDIYVINDRYLHSNYLYKNMGDGTFQDVSESSGSNLNFDAMSITVGDYDNDEDLDLYVTNTAGGNALLQNQGDGTFAEIAESAGVSVFEICWGALWIDFDNNMLQDLYVATIENVGTTDLLNRLYRNTGSDFIEVTDEAGLSDDIHGTLAVSMGDINNDGFPDFVQNNIDPSFCQLYQNSGNENNWLKVSVEGVVSNRDGIGAWIQIFTNDIVQTRTINCGEHFLGQDSPREMFGCAQYETIDSVLVSWPSGIVDSYYDVEVNQTLHSIEGSSVLSPITVEGSLVLCGSDSTLLTASAGVEYNWSNGADSQSVYVTSEGMYTCDVTSEWGIIFQSEQIVVTSAPAPSINQSIQNVSCYGAQDGSVIITSDDGVELTSIEWDHTQADFTIGELQAGTYYYTLDNANGCIVSDSATVSQPDSLILSALVQDVNCFGESSGQVQISWTGGIGNVNCDINGQDPEFLSAGIYNWICVDGNECESHVQFEVNEPNELTVEIDVSNLTSEGIGMVEAIATGGTGNYAFEWSTGSESSIIEIEQFGDFWVNVTDENGCNEMVNFSTTTVQEFELNKYSVHPNPFSNEFTFSNYSSETLIFELFDPLGRTVEKGQLFPGDNLIELMHHSCDGIWVLKIVSEKSTKSFRLFSY